LGLSPSLVRAAPRGLRPRRWERRHLDGFMNGGHEAHAPRAWPPTDNVNAPARYGRPVSGSRPVNLLYDNQAPRRRTPAAPGLHALGRRHLDVWRAS
jgi:hypothetical protein